MLVFFPDTTGTRYVPRGTYEADRVRFWAARGVPADTVKILIGAVTAWLQVTMRRAAMNGQNLEATLRATRRPPTPHHAHEKKMGCACRRSGISRETSSRCIHRRCMRVPPISRTRL